MFHGEEFWFVRFLFQRGLALLYLLAFLVAAFQFRPLAGEDGLLPLEWYAEGADFRERPSLFYCYPSDRVIGITAWAGVVLSALALLAVPYWLPEPYPTPASIVLWAAMWALYQSFVNAGQTFYGYGWESMLLETGFLAIFLGAGAVAPPVIILVLLQWVLFRNMFGAGLIKLRGDDCWRDLSCMDYHYETQPIPNPLSWFAHHLPKRFHRVETFGNHVVELLIPFLYFAPQPASSLAGAATIGFMLSQQLSSSGQQMVSQALTNPSGRAAASVVGFFGVVWSALKLFRGLDQAFDEIYADEVDVSLLGQVWDGIVVIVGIALSVALVVAVGAALSILNLQIPFANVLGSLVLIVVLAIAFLPIYYVLPPMDVSVRSVLPGTIVAAIGWVLLQIGFRIYAANAGKYAAYGVIGAVLLFVTWLYFGSIVILLGAAVNAVRRGATAGTT